MSLDNFRNRTIIWDTVNKDFPQPIQIMQGDVNARTLSVKILDNGGEIDLTGHSLKLTYQYTNSSNSGFVMIPPENLTKGEFILVIPTEMTKAGVIEANLILLNKDKEQVIVSKNLTFISDNSTVTDLAQEVNNKIDDFTKLLLENMPQVLRSELNDLHAQTDSNKSNIELKANLADVTSLQSAMTDLEKEVEAFGISPENLVTIKSLLDAIASKASESEVVELKNSVKVLTRNISLMSNGDYSPKANQTALDTEKNERIAEVAVERARINSFTTLAQGSTTGDAELIDTRIGANGITYPNVGTAVRKQIGRISSEFSFLKDGYETLNSVFVNGNLTKGTLVTSKSRIASLKLMQYTRPVTLAISSGFKVGVHSFDSHGNFIADSGWKTGTYNIDAGVKFKAVIARVAENVNETADVDEFVNAVLVKTIGRDVADNVEISMVDIKAVLHFTIGGIKTPTGVDYEGQPWRIRSSITSIPYDIEIRKADGYQFLVVTFSDANYTNPVSSGWIVSNGSSFTVSKDTYFRILALRTGHDNSTYTITNITTSDIFNNIFVYRADGIIMELENKLNHIGVSKDANQCILSISHQGYSTTSQYYGNSRLSSYLGSYLHGFECAEVDIAWSSDGVPVCCHDATFIDTHDNRTVITIADHTVDELKTYGYYGETIATLDEVVSTCKTYGLKLELDKVSSVWTDTQWQRVFDIVTKYQMQEFIIWTSPNTTCATKILTYDKWATIMINANANTMSSDITLAKSIATDYNKIIIACNYTGLSVANLITYNAQIPERNIGIGVWTIDDAETYLKYLPYSVCITSNKLCEKDVMP